MFFNFKNHGKIIMTNNVAYVGSANYSDESRHNIEFGFISRNQDYIKFLKNEMTKEIEELSTPYFEYDYLPLLLEVKMHLSNLFALKEELFNQVYSYYDDLDGEGYFYNDTEDRLRQITIDNIIKEINECTKYFDTICDVAYKLTDDDNVLDELNEYYENLEILEKQFEDISCNEKLFELVCFDSTERANSILQEEYSAEAYDEYLDGYAQIAMDKAHEEFQDLCQETREELDSMIKTIQDYLVLYKESLEEFEDLEFRKVSENIDNT
ncbi:phospholipase D-like domain-containing protein [Senegalia sp. (in: firmicutes)]|uniref:phospholipase D-like domain-containing protein n=2 Tax=Senegalia sp. (in: firmicutes) TaxID=1924098 RepID=UPI003F98A271